MVHEVTKSWTQLTLLSPHPHITYLQVELKLFERFFLIASQNYYQI